MMDDRLDELLARLPSEPPAPDLSARIIAAVAQRRRAPFSFTVPFIYQDRAVQWGEKSII